MSVFNEGDSKDTEYGLPDGQIIKFGSQQIRCVEALFKPQLFCKDFVGVHQAAFNSIQRCDIGTRRDLFKNIILSGGNTLYKGLSDRMAREITTLAPSNTNVKVIAPSERKYSVWIGGSILCLLSTFEAMWVRKSEYFESGASLVFRKCF